MRILESAEATIYEPTDDVMWYCRKNLTIKNPEYTRRLRRGLCLGHTAEYLDLYRQRESSVLPLWRLSWIEKLSLDGGFAPAGRCGDQF